MHLSVPRIAVVGLAGDSGKTLVTLGLVGALSRRGMRVAGFKKGPDYIDAAWLTRAGGRPGRNLDTFLMDDAALAAVLAAERHAGIWVLEGNRGLFDGLDAAGSHSSAALAHRLGFPLLLVLDVTKMTRTAAALVMGCRALDPDLPLAGVVLNRVANPRHERIVREALHAVGGPPVLGALPRLSGRLLPGRHLGLVTVAEHPDPDEAIESATDAVAAHVDLDAVERAAHGAPAIELPEPRVFEARSPVRIGVLRDEAFSFYYPENLEALERLGAELVFVSPLHDQRLPEIDALYAGGGFPEQHAARLSGNRELLSALAARLEQGLPAWAECGGLICLSRALTIGGRSWPMAGFLDLLLSFEERPQGHGYVEGVVARENPFFAPGTRLRGHEFHYTRIVGGVGEMRPVVDLVRGRGVDGRSDGIVRSATWASWTHLHALTVPAWAEALVERAGRWRARRDAGDESCSGRGWAARTCRTGRG